MEPPLAVAPHSSPPNGETHAPDESETTPSRHNRRHRRNHSDGDALVKAMQLQPRNAQLNVSTFLKGSVIDRGGSPRPPSPIPSPSASGDSLSSTRVSPLIGASRSHRTALSPTVQFAERPIAQLLSPLRRPRTPPPPPSPLASSPSPSSPHSVVDARPASPPLPAVVLPAGLPRLEEVRFDERDSESNLHHDEDPERARQVRAASVGKLIEKLTLAESAEEYAQLVVLTHSTWLPATAFVALLEQRYKATTDLRVRALVVDALRLWVEHVYESAAAPLVQAFIRSIEATHSTVMGTGSLVLLQRTLEQAATGKLIKQRAPLSPRGLPPALRRGGGGGLVTQCAAVEDVPAMELARHLSKHDEALFTALTARELCNVAWTRSNKDVLAPNVMALVTRFNVLVNFTQWRILASEKAEARARSIRYFIKTARRLHDLHNYHAMYALVTGLQATSVKRLQHTWNLVKRHRIEKLTRLVELMSIDAQYQTYREHLARLSSSTPCVPYIAPYLGTLTFIEEMPRVVNGLVNVARLHAVHNTTQALLRFQLHPAYSFDDAAPWVNESLLSGPLFTESQLYKKSLQCEPRLSVGGSARGAKS